MSEVNLLPWREWRRQRAIRRWQVLLLAALVTGALAMVLAGVLLARHLESQLRENARLVERIDGLDGLLVEAGGLRARHDALLAQREELLSLQRQRRGAVELLAGLALALPAQVRLDGLHLTEDGLRLAGVTRSGAEVPRLLQALAQVPGLGVADLQEVTTSPAGERFRIAVELRRAEPGPA